MRVTFLFQRVRKKSQAPEVLATVHAKNLPGDVGRTRAAEKENRCGNVGRFEKAAQKALCERGVLHRLWHDFSQRRAHPPAFDDVDENAEAADFSRDTLG